MSDISREIKGLLRVLRRGEWQTRAMVLRMLGPLDRGGIDAAVAAGLVEAREERMGRRGPLTQLLRITDAGRVVWEACQ